MSDREIELTRRQKETDRSKAVVEPTPKLVSLFEFLVGLFEDNSFPEKIVLWTAHGPGGIKDGTSIKEHVVKPNAAKPTREELVALSNMFVQLAQEHCDYLSQKASMLFAVRAYDLARSDRAYASQLIRIQASGTVATTEEQLEDENPITLLKDQLRDSRQHERWVLEQTLQAMGSMMDRDSARIASLERITDGFVAKQIELLKATEEAISMSEERKSKAEWQRFKQEQIAMGIQLLTTVGFPEIMKRIDEHQKIKALEAGAPKDNASAAMSPEPKPDPNPVRDFIESVTDEQGPKAFGTNDEKTGRRVADGVFTEEQTMILFGLCEKFDENVADALIASITPEQMNKAREIFDMQQLLPLIMWYNKRKAEKGT